MSEKELELFLESLLDNSSVNHLILCRTHSAFVKHCEKLKINGRFLNDAKFFASTGDIYLYVNYGREGAEIDRLRGMKIKSYKFI